MQSPKNFNFIYTYYSNSKIMTDPNMQRQSSFYLLEPSTIKVAIIILRSRIIYSYNSKIISCQTSTTNKHFLNTHNSQSRNNKDKGSMLRSTSTFIRSIDAFMLFRGAWGYGNLFRLSISGVWFSTTALPALLVMRYIA